MQYQGTNSRALTYHLLQCREDNTRDPQLTEATIQHVLETVVNENWLQLESGDQLKAVKDGTQSLKTVLESKTATERDIFLWNYAGVLMQTGEWRRFHSLEEMYVLLASFWGMRAPKIVPTCTTWSIFQDEGIQIQMDGHRQHKYYLSLLRRSPSPGRRGPRSETSAPRTPIQTPKPPPTLEDLIAISDPTWNPDLHQGMDYLWAIMQVTEQEAFLKGLAAQRESTSMSTMVQIISDDTQPAIEPAQAPPTEEAPEQSVEATEEGPEQLVETAAEDPDQPEDQPDPDGHQGEAGDTPAASSDQADQEVPQEEPGDAPVIPSDRPEPDRIKKESDSVKQEDDQTDDELTTDDLLSQVAMAGSLGGDQEPPVHSQPTQGRRNNLARYRIGDLGLDSFIDIFNVLCATASRYTDSVGTFVRKLSLSGSLPRVRELIGEFDPVIVFVDTEIEEAIRSMAGDLSVLRQKYPLQQGIDWITFQYHLTLLQRDGPLGWDAPGFRMGGRIPMSVADICQNYITHEESTHCHSTPFREWQRVRHMVTMGRDAATRENYVHDAVSALAL